MYYCSDGPLIGGICDGHIVRTHTVIDACTNAASCTQIISLVDTNPPTLTCPGDLVVPNDPGQCSAVVNYTVTATDSCGGCALLSEDFDAGDGGFTVDTPQPFDGPWVYNAATGSWGENGQAPENSRPNTSMLNSPAINVTCAGPVRLTFVHRWSFRSRLGLGCSPFAG